MQEEESLLRLKSIQVEGLFNLYSHTVDLKMDDRVTIIHGPNGVGKTALLKLVVCLISGNIADAVKTPFEKLSIEFNNGSRLEVHQKEEKNKRSGGIETKKSGRLLYIQRGKKDEVFDLPDELFNAAALASTLASKTAFLKRVDENTWIDVRDDEVLSADEVIERFSRSPRASPKFFYNSIRHRNRTSFELPEWFKGIKERINVHLIETQRLIRTSQKTSRSWDDEAEPQLVVTVREYANNLKQRISETMTMYGKESQALDQTFPRRLLDRQGALAVDELKRQLNDIEQKTQHLERIGLIQEKTSSSFGAAMPSNMDDTERRAMSLYAGDTGKKLKVLDNLAKRIGLFLDNVNKKFRHKSVRIERDSGFVAERENGLLLPLDSLSSGEQHELVLLYDLLFRVKENTIVLIDEPELSLHVSWQKGFLDDLLQIVKATNYDVLVATHSPFIAGERPDLMVALSDR